VCVAGCLAGPLAAIGTPAAAYWRPEMNALDVSGFASPDEIASAVGAVSIEVVCPDDRAGGQFSARGARLTLGNTGAGYRDKRVLSTLLHGALDRIWDECEMYDRIGEAHGLVDFQVGFVDIYAPSGSGGSSALVISARTYAGAFGTWDSITDIAAQQAEQAAQASQQAQAAQAAQQDAAARAAQDARDQADANVRQQQWDEGWARVWQAIKVVAGIGTAGLLLSWLIVQRDAIARWYYFTFDPHPAANLVHTAIQSAAPISGAALAQALSELPPRGVVLRSVRLVQAEALFHEMQRASEARLRAQRARAQDAYERAALASIQEAVALAAVALERAKALYRASQKR
jgi:hypothetical protein